MKAQIIGLGNVGRNLVKLLQTKTKFLAEIGANIKIVSVSDSSGTAIDENGLDLSQVMKYKKLQWKGYSKYQRGRTAIDAINNVDSDLVIELTPSTLDGEPGLTNIMTAFRARRHVVTANKGPLACAYTELIRTAEEMRVSFLYEATVAAQVPIFCMINSCFLADEIVKVEGILNATTNFIIGEIENGKTFQEALDKAIADGWAETNYADDIDGVDAARKVVILANSLFRQRVKLSDVRVEGIRRVESMIRRATLAGEKIKLVCEIEKKQGKVKTAVKLGHVPMSDPLATVKHGDMGVKFLFKTSKQIFVSAQFLGPMQTAYAVLNDSIKIALNKRSC